MGDLLSSFPFFNTSTAGCKPALHRAIKANDEKMVLTLLSHRTAPDERDEQRNTPLHLACALGGCGMAHILINHLIKRKKELSMSSKNAKGLSPLMLAAKQGSVYMMELLFDNGAKQDVKDTSGKTCMLVAAEVGNGKGVALCLARGHDANMMDDEGNTALHLASLRGHAEVISVLLADPLIEGHANHAGYRPEQISISDEIKDKIETGLEVAHRKKRTIAWIQKQTPAAQEEEEVEPQPSVDTRDESIGSSREDRSTSRA